MKKISMILISCILISASGCKKYIDVNQNPNQPIDVAEAQILAPVELDISSSLYAGNVAVIVQEYMQVAALNQVAPNAGTYLMYNSDMDGDWGNLYVTCLNNLVTLNQKATADGKSNYAGIAKILTAYCLGTGTDLWGDMPYSQAFKGSAEFTPVYDAQKDIYTQIQSLLDAGIADIAKNGTVKPGGDDFFYAGDMSKWTKLAYTLKARYYMHLTKAPGYTASTQAQLALTALEKGMQSNDDDFKMAYTGAAGGENPWQQNFISASTVVLGSTFVNGFSTRSDPRLSAMVAPATATGLYTGLGQGLNTIGQLEDYSRPGDFYGATGATNYIVNYSEALFLKAEATLITSGYTSAAPVYQSAVLSHMTKLGVSTDKANAYLASRTLTASNAEQLIIEEKGIANFLSLENFTDYRRTGYPVLPAVPNALSAIPRRVLYPQAEITSNPQPQQTAKLTDRVWWDVK
ncbi:SusD/RagB family nutrient-binding outer membrane lipoprotein [Mucilaginibacter sp. KACC 22773]|uniref:SusD/RagB family nutrient-binding outer membrane lipoprotein n=1 Tax=Mucilaginibacter sp. KACC 22773 TaxID=3025671 RepID=UPI0023670B65|nr:SusD/RagB family nutrient-binding outer membrane lipoprotein [Mucilaginibacter sp. KACC 22773]WDF79080.1 SusD/RagB family nutrient-binding outer membrane lipoprotein [Mucilaginibacter sp. KACC 22773]